MILVANTSPHDHKLNKSSAILTVDTKTEGVFSFLGAFMLQQTAN